MRGSISELVPDRGFGLISDQDGREYFFHRGALMGVDSTFDVGGKDENGFQAESAVPALARRDVAGHHSDKATRARNPHDHPQGDQGLPPRERRQRVAHHLDALGHRQEARHLLTIEHQDFHQATAASILDATASRSSVVK